MHATVQFAARKALSEKRNDAWKTVTWADYAEQVKHISLGLAAMGLSKGDRVCILSESRPEWLYADMAIICAGGASVGIYPTSSQEQIEYFLDDSGASNIFVSSVDLLAKVLPVQDKLQHPKKIIVFDDVEKIASDADDIVSLSYLMDLGRKLESENRTRFADLANTVTADDLAVLIYTSGTTGPPNGVMLTHRNIMFEVAVHDKYLHIAEGDDLISFLPLSHIAERMLTCFRPMMHGARVTFSQGPEKLADEIREVSPHVFFAVPRIWEKFHTAITAAMDKASPFQRWSYKTALGIGMRAARYKYNARKVPVLLTGIQSITDQLVMQKVRTKIGMGRAHFVICGAAPVSSDLLMWMAAIGLDVRETYGLTENGSVAAIAPLDMRKLGSVGLAPLDSDIQIADDGEILIRGDHVFTGYINKQEATGEALKDGWLHSGDIGRLDEDGFLYITGRKKDIIITSGGKNISPAQSENELKFHPLIADCMLVGDGRKYLTCLIMLDPINVIAYAAEHGVENLGFAELSRNPKILTMIETEINRVNQQVSRVEQVKKFRVLDKPLSPGDPALTPTMKLKRDVVAARYSDLIDSMYTQDIETHGRA